MENKTVDIYLFGKKYSVPDNLTIMTAMEYAGYQLKRGCGCRGGFCGACATIYRIKGKRSSAHALHVRLRFRTACISLRCLSSRLSSRPMI